MSWSEIVFGVLLVIALLALSVYFARRQFAVLRRLRASDFPVDDEHLYERRKARRRLVSCALTLLLAVLIASLLLCWESTAGRVIRERAGVDPSVPPTAEQRLLVRVWGGLWLGVLVVMLVVLALAAADLWATRRFAQRQYRKIADDRRAMIRRQITRLRQERNGEH